MRRSRYGQQRDDAALRAAIDEAGYDVAVVSAGE